MRLFYRAIDSSVQTNFRTTSCLSFFRNAGKDATPYRFKYMTPAGKILRSATILRHDLAIVTLPSPYSPCKLINRSFMQRALTTSCRSVGLYLASIATYGGKFLTMTWFERHWSCPEGIMPFLLICLHTWSSFCLLRGFYLDGCSSCLSSLKSFSFSASCSFPLPSTSFACSTAWAKALQIVSPKSKF